MTGSLVGRGGLAQGRTCRGTRRGTRPRLVALCLALALAGCGTSRPEPPPPLLPPAPGGQACLNLLRSDGADAKPIRFPPDGACRIDTPVRARSLGVALAPATMGCTLAARLDQFNREVIQPAADDIFEQPVVRLTHFGSYNCRKESSGRNRLSQHAFGKAFDLAGFVLKDGSKITILDDWDGGGRNERFVHRIAHEACRYFSVVLTPDSNDDHKNHLHLDIGPDRLCGPS